jgi:hypothetical protein
VGCSVMAPRRRHDFLRRLWRRRVRRLLPDPVQHRLADHDDSSAQKIAVLGGWIQTTRSRRDMECGLVVDRAWSWHGEPSMTQKISRHLVANPEDRR